MLVDTGYIFRCPGYSFYKVSLADRAVGDLADRAGDGLAVVHMKIELYTSLGVSGEKNDHLFHFVMGVPKAVIPGKGNVGINMEIGAKLLDLHVVYIDPFGAAVVFQYFNDLVQEIGVLFIHNAA